MKPANVIIVFLLLSSILTHAQSPAQTQPLADTTGLTLDTCYALATANYPQIREKELILRTRDYSVANAAKGYLPQVNFTGQATYQTQTIAFPFNIPGASLPVYSKDQYKVQAEVDQTIYDAGAIRFQQQLKNADEAIQLQSLNVDLYALHDRVNQLFFGILMVDEQLKLNQLQHNDLQNGVDKSQASVNNGTAFRSSLDELKAELLRTEQERTELLATRKAYTRMLSLFINRSLDENSALIAPPPVVPSSSAPGTSTASSLAPAASAPGTSTTSPLAPAPATGTSTTPSLASAPSPGGLTDITRPELALFDLRKRAFDIQEEQLHVAYTPKISAFLQGAYGRPTLNFISNDFGFWALGGIHLSWSLSGLYTNKNDKRLLALDRRDLDLQKETFLLNTRLTLTQQQAEAEKYQALADQDQQIIDLRASVKTAALAQLQNGVITSHDYVNQVNAESQARQNLVLHRIQLLQAQYETKTTSGN